MLIDSRVHITEPGPTANIHLAAYQHNHPKVTFLNGLTRHPLFEALKTIKAKSTDDKERARADWVLARARARYYPPSVTAQDLERVAGSYETGRVWVEGGQLRFQRANESPYLLVPITGTVYASETDDPIRIEFVLLSGGKVQKLLLEDEDGSVHELMKTG